MNRYIKLFNGWIRLFIWGVCPKCNHDAPKLYDCNICEYYDKLPRYKSSQTKEQKVVVWINFKQQILDS